MFADHVDGSRRIAPDSQETVVTRIPSLDFRPCRINAVSYTSGSSEERFRITTMRCLRSLFIIFTALFVSSRLIAQSPQNAPRIAGPVDETSLVVLTGSVPSIARAEFDRGEAPASTQLSHV